METAHAIVLIWIRDCDYVKSREPKGLFKNSFGVPDLGWQLKPHPDCKAG